MTKSVRTETKSPANSESPSRLTEDGLIAAVSTLVTPRRGAPLAVSIGDDAAAWRPSRSHLSVISTDAMVEGVHFTRESISPRELGGRALGSALSDVAAMGARPVLATIALALPKTVDMEYVCELYRGLDALASRTRTAIAGGDIVRSVELSLCVTVVGEVRGTRLKRRDGARAGDAIGVTGFLGASRAGLTILRRDWAGVLALSYREQALRAHRMPEPRLREGAWLAASASVHAMMDVSDGLSTDLARICRASRCSAVIETVPVAPCAAHVAREVGEDPESFALAGGEDFELLVAVAPRAFTHLAQRFRLRFGRPLLRIGTFTAGEGVFLRDAGIPRPLPSTGWDHMRE